MHHADITRTDLSQAERADLRRQRKESSQERSSAPRIILGAVVEGSLVCRHDRAVKERERHAFSISQIAIDAGDDIPIGPVPYSFKSAGADIIRKALYPGRITDDYCVEGLKVRLLLFVQQCEMIAGGKESLRRGRRVLDLNPRAKADVRGPNHRGIRPTLSAPIEAGWA
jgi:hypothetical protein